MRCVVVMICACATPPIEQTVDQQLMSPTLNLSSTAAPSLIQGNWGNNVAIDGRGQVHAVWTEGAPSNAAVAYRRSGDDGLTWSAMGTFGASPRTFGPRVAASGDNVYITWSGLYEGFNAVYLIRS